MKNNAPPKGGNKKSGNAATFGKGKVVPKNPGGRKADRR